MNRGPRKMQISYRGHAADQDLALHHQPSTRSRPHRARSLDQDAVTRSS